MKVFLSSTAQDLDGYRKVAEETILQLSQQVVAMKYFGALPGTPVEECQRLARDSDVVVCIVAHRYGSGITRLEVEAAHKAGKDVLVWIVADDYPWAEKKEENVLADPNVFSDRAKAEEVRQRVQALFDFKAWLQTTFTVDRFTLPDDLGKKIALALTNYVNGHAAPPVAQDRISIARLRTTSSNLFGRSVELKILNEAWENRSSNIVTFVAWAGVGKTTLVNHWLKQHMARDNYRDADRVLGWSFFSQGTRERAASSDLFMDYALRWFGDTDAALGSPSDKGERLAHYIRQSRTLLILDGLEPLQHPRGSHEGRLKDVAMQALLIELAADQPGLCVISTREPIGDLCEFQHSTVIQHNLEHLSPQAGAQILRSFKVKGDNEELENAAKEMACHAFSLTLLGSYLNEVLDGDIRRRQEIENLFEDTRYGDVAEKMIAAYENWLGEGMEIAILRLLGFFDRPADLGAIEVLREPPAITGLTQPLQQFKGRQWNQAVAKLRRINLLGESSPTEPGQLDAHPLVREYFKQRLKRKSSKAWYEANKRLYEYLKRTTKEFPETVQEMSPLYAAVAHGCSAGLYQDALHEVYRRRIQRGRLHFNTNRLGAIGMESATLSGFFETLWSRPVEQLADLDKGFVLHEAGASLRSQGRLEEAVQVAQAAFDISRDNGQWGNAATAACNVSGLHLTIGDLKLACSFAQQSAKLADRSGRQLERSVTRATLADVLHQSGLSEAAGATFREAEQILQACNSPFPLLYSTWGFYYCDWILSQGYIQSAKERAAKALEWTKQNLGPSSNALARLSLGRALLHEAKQTKSSSNNQTGELFQRAVDGLRKCGDLCCLPLGLLSRAEFYRFTGEDERARRDLAEVQRIANRCGMGLFMADYHLESGRLQLQQNERGTAREHLAIAKEMINRMGYNRRDKEVAELEARLA